MARPSRSLAAAARRAALEEARPLRFIADYDHVTPAVTTSYRAGSVLTVPPEHRRAALASGKAVVA